MLCPCCGCKLERAAPDCVCGARFVGHPLDDPPMKVQRLGPAMIAGLLLFLVVACALIANKWFALAAVFVVWSAHRAMRLARREPEWYGGYRFSAVIMVVTIAGGLVAGGFAVARIPELIENHAVRQRAATLATFYHICSSLEDYKHNYGSYPSNMQAIRSATDQALPLDYWSNPIRYVSYTEAIADQRPAAIGIPVSNFELRSPGPDGVEGTEDDIVMRDNLVVTNPVEIKKLIVRDSTGR
jgi:hypothetical protein